MKRMVPVYAAGALIAAVWSLSVPVSAATPAPQQESALIEAARDNDADAVARLQAVNAAYAVLADSARREPRDETGRNACVDGTERQW